MNTKKPRKEKAVKAVKSVEAEPVVEVKAEPEVFEVVVGVDKLLGLLMLSFFCSFCCSCCCSSFRFALAAASRSERDVTAEEARGSDETPEGDPAGDP